MGEGTAREDAVEEVLLHSHPLATTLPGHEGGSNEGGDHNDCHRRNDPNPTTDDDKQGNLDWGYRDEQQEEQWSDPHPYEDNGMVRLCIT